MHWPITVGLRATYVGWTMGHLPDSLPRLTFRLSRENFWDSIKMPSGSNLLDCEGFLHLHASEDAAFEVEVAADADLGTDAEMVQCIGRLFYSEASEASSDGLVRPMDESYSVGCGLPQSQIDRLLQAIRAGEIPQTIRLTIPEGLKLGHMPDGGDMTWKDAKKHVLAVEGISFGYHAPSAEDHRGQDEDLDEATDRTDPALALLGQWLGQLEDGLTRQSLYLQQIQKHLSWIWLATLACAICVTAISLKLG